MSAEFFDHDNTIAESAMATIEIESSQGEMTLTITDEDGQVSARGKLFIDHNVPIFELYRGRRGGKVGNVTRMRFIV